MLGPILEGERVRLEPPRPEPAPTFMRQCGRWRRNRFFGGEGHDEWLGEIRREEWKG